MAARAAAPDVNQGAAGHRVPCRDPDMTHPLPPSAPSRSARWRRAGVRLLGLSPLFLLSGCGMALFTPQGAIGDEEKNLILIALGLMLMVVIPVIGLTLYFAWRFRASNTKAT